jgi:hypothetical protein
LPYALAESGSYQELAQEAFHCEEKKNSLLDIAFAQTSAAETAATLHGIMY